MAMDSLILISNPGSASRKYALYGGSECLLKIHFEETGDKLVYGWLSKAGAAQNQPAGISHLAFAASQLPSIISKLMDAPEAKIKTVALRIVAPSTYFQTDRLLDSASLQKLTSLESTANLHINASLQEAHLLLQAFGSIKLVGISDSAFYAELPKEARHYGLPPKDAKTLDVYRFGYHGLSSESVVEKLRLASKLPKRLLVCHLGSGASVTAVKNGKAVDCSMGFSPLEGLVMATRSGSIDVVAAQVLQKGLGLSDQQLRDYLNHKSGLLGLSGKSSDIRQLLVLEESGDEGAVLALDSYVYRVQQAIGAMAAGLGGVDALVFTGTVGERSAEMRKRIVCKLLFLGLALDPHANHASRADYQTELLSPPSYPAKIYVISADEDSVMAKRAQVLAKT